MLVTVTVPLALRPMTSEPLAEPALVSADVVRMLLVLVVVVPVVATVVPVVTGARRFAAAVGEGVTPEVTVGVSTTGRLLKTGAAAAVVAVVVVATLFAAVVGVSVVAAVVGVRVTAEAVAPVVGTGALTAASP